MIKGYTILNINDPLEQFLSLNLYPGCTINNWDSFRYVLFIGLIFSSFLLVIYNSINSSVFMNFNLASKYEKLDKSLWSFPTLFIDSNLVNKKLSIKSKKIEKNLDLSFNIINIFININSKALKSFNHFIIIFIQKIMFFISNIIKENLHINKYMFFSLYFFSFISILFFNMIGLLPYSVTATSSFIMILNYSFSILIGLNIIGFYLHSVKYFNQFLPEGVPLFIAPVLVIIELFSNIIRIFSLTVRLFANILAGHSLLKILIGVSWSLISSFILFVPVATLVWLILTPIFLLECIIAFLQAYVYVLLLIIYTNDVINIH